MSITPLNELPNFLTKTMLAWLGQFYSDTTDTITEIGCFEWKIKIDKRNPTKPKKTPIITEFYQLKSSPFSRSIYFLEENQHTLFVFFSNGFQLSGQSVIYQYTWDGSIFIKEPKKIVALNR